MRKSLYLSERLDADIIKELDLENIPSGDFSLVAKQLMRDGIKWRELQRQSQPQQREHQPVQENPQPAPVKKEFKAPLQKVKYSSKKLEDKLDLL